VVEMVEAKAKAIRAAQAAETIKAETPIEMKA
jgi:hypothetical protein